MKILYKKTKEAKETEILVIKEKNEAQLKKGEINILEKQCQKVYEEALPTLKSA